MYETGRGVEKNTEEALRFYKRASYRGDVDACYRVGLHGAKWSIDRACSYECGCTFRDCGAHCETCHAAQLAGFPFLECAAERGHMGAQYWLGHMHEESDVPPCVHSRERREELAFEWYSRAAEQGHAGARSALGYRLYESGDYTRAETLLRKAADQGDESAAYRLRSMYEETPNAKWTVAWYVKAAEKGNAQAQFELGRMYHTGDRVPEDHARAATWYRAAAKVNVQALTALDEMCDHPDERGSRDVQFWLWRKSTKHDEGAAVRWLAEAAEQGDAQSQLLIGLQMIESDAANARVWLTRASDQGHAEAAFMLGLMMAINLGGPGDAKTAETLMVKAAESGSGFALLALGDMADGVDAVRFYTKASEGARFAFRAHFHIGDLYSMGVQPDAAKASAHFRAAATWARTSASTAGDVARERGRSYDSDYPSRLGCSVTVADPARASACYREAAVLYNGGNAPPRIFRHWPICENAKKRIMRRVVVAEPRFSFM
jgi:TPR repeat protein